MAVETPGDSCVISAKYGDHRMSRPNATDFLPFLGTDIGTTNFKNYPIFKTFKFGELVIQTVTCILHIPYTILFF